MIAELTATLDGLLCARCGEMLEDAVTLRNGRRACPACVCHGCSENVYRFVDADNDDQQLCEACVMAEVARRACSACCEQTPDVRWYIAAEAHLCDYCANVTNGVTR